MAGYNRVVLIGNLTRDPEYKQLASGQPVCRLGLAVNRQYKNRQTGDMVQEVCFVDIDVWGPQAESCRQYLQKGRPVLVEGRLKLDTWEDQNGQNRSKHSVVADRVVFLSQQANEYAPAEREDADDRNAPLDPSNPMEKELMDQIDDIKRKTAMKKAEPAQAPSTGEVSLQDEPPFQDDLPF